VPDSITDSLAAQAVDRGGTDIDPNTPVCVLQKQAKTQRMFCIMGTLSKVITDYLSHNEMMEDSVDNCHLHSGGI
jgi:hypothetical protein